MLLHVHLDNRAFTLIEFLVAIVIISVGLLGLLQSVNFAISANSSSLKRGNAVVIADQVMNMQRTLPFSLVQAKNSSAQIRTNAGFINYSINRTIPLTPTASTKQVTVTVSWRDRGAKKQHDLSTLITDMPALNN